MVCKDTLRIKHLPKELNDIQKEDFARHFGAIKVKVITSRIKANSIVYAKFESPEIAKNVLFRLHQLEILNSRLCVEYAENDILQGKPKLKKIEESDISKNKFFRTFINKVNAFNDSLGFHQPPPSHLKYNYPKGNRATINNMAHALATVPRFYTQVLHLMNKMNLPPPFAVAEPPVRTITPSQHPAVQKNIEKAIEKKVSESESELESDSEENKSKTREIIPQKRKLPQKKMAVKRPKFIKNPAPKSGTVNKPQEIAEGVFEKVEVQPQKKIELKVSSEPTRVPVTEQQQETGTFGLPNKPDLESDLPVPATALKEPYISLEELSSNQIQPKDLDVLPVFKNYHPGVPTNRLYIKNCAKSVVLEDLEYIYKRYQVEESDIQEKSEFNIRLMQEGRMKGQAFVTMDSVELAQRAIKETNGYILKDKPLVVVFAKSAAPKK